MTDSREMEMIHTLHNKWRYHRQHTYEWQDKNEARFRDIIARLEALEQRHPELADADAIETILLLSRRLDAHERAIDVLSTVQGELLRRLEALESPASYVSISKEELIAKLERERLASHPDPDPCAGGFCPVELFRPIDDTEGSN